MLTWLHRFFYSDDPDVRLATGLSEFDAEQFAELLRNSGVMSMMKDTSPLAINRYIWPTASGNGYALWVKRSDVEAARHILGHLLNRYETEEARERARSRDSTTDSHSG